MLKRQSYRRPVRWIPVVAIAACVSLLVWRPAVGSNHITQSHAAQPHSARAAHFLGRGLAAVLMMTSTGISPLVHAGEVGARLDVGPQEKVLRTFASANVYEIPIGERRSDSHQKLTFMATGDVVHRLNLRWTKGPDGRRTEASDGWPLRLRTALQAAFEPSGTTAGCGVEADIKKDPDEIRPGVGAFCNGSQVLPAGFGANASAGYNRFLTGDRASNNRWETSLGVTYRLDHEPTKWWEQLLHGAAVGSYTLDTNSPHFLFGGAGWNEAFVHSGPLTIGDAQVVFGAQREGSGYGDMHNFFFVQIGKQF